MTSAADKEHEAITHIEKTLADSYRKEIDQEENVWRTLPFFAATLALQLTVVLQLLDRIVALEGTQRTAAIVLLGGAGLSSLTAMGLLLASIFFRKFKYPAPEVALLEYTLGLIADEADDKAAGLERPRLALPLLKTALASQYAASTQNNRRINKFREACRAFAGMTMTASLVCTIVLVAITFAHYI